MTDVSTIAYNLNKKQNSFQFYPAGYGCSYDNSITSLQKYQDVLKKNYDSETTHHLIYISASSEMNEIENDYDLFRAAKYLENDAYLSVPLGEMIKKTGNNRSKCRKNGACNFCGVKGHSEDDCILNPNLSRCDTAIEPLRISWLEYSQPSIRVL